MKRIIYISISIIIFYFIFIYSSAWKKGSYNSCQDLANALVGISYESIADHYGAPQKEYIHWNGAVCDSDVCIEYTWDDIRVKGGKAKIAFNAFRLSGTMQVSPNRVSSVECY